MNLPDRTLTPDEVDELLSAELDGEFERAAGDLGLSAPEARAQLDATPEVNTRRAAMTRARDQLAVRPTLEPEREDRLVANALPTDELAAARGHRGRDRQWRMLVASASVAAAIAVVIGVSATNGHNSSKSTAASAAKSASPIAANGSAAPSATPSGKPHNFGDVTRGAALDTRARQLLDARKQSATSALSTTSPGPAPNTVAATPGKTPEVASQPVAGSADKAFAVDLASCIATVRQRNQIASEPAIVGTGTVAGRPVVILIFDNGRTPIAYVVRASDCSPVRTQTLR